jgi:tRNA (guanine-N7-)-methyltransferase
MKPKDLMHPFTWEERRVLIQDRVWFSPDCQANDAFRFPGWSHPDIFGNDLPVKVEYCSGNGEWIAKKALDDPQSNWVAIEKRFDRTRLIWSKIKKRKLNNLFVICGEGYQVTSTYFNDRSIKEIFINFPDPWPKRKHTKHRILKNSFIEQLLRILFPGGTLTVVTDDIEYSDNLNHLIKLYPAFFPAYSSPHYTNHIEGYGASFFDRLWRQKGKEIRYHLYKKLNDFA